MKTKFLSLFWFSIFLTLVILGTIKGPAFALGAFVWWLISFLILLAKKH